MNFGPQQPDDQCMSKHGKITEMTTSTTTATKPLQAVKEHYSDKENMSRLSKAFNAWAKKQDSQEKSAAQRSA